MVLADGSFLCIRCLYNNKISLDSPRSYHVYGELDLSYTYLCAVGKLEESNIISPGICLIDHLLIHQQDLIAIFSGISLVFVLKAEDCYYCRTANKDMR